MNVFMTFLTLFALLLAAAAASSNRISSNNSESSDIGKIQALLQERLRHYALQAELCNDLFDAMNEIVQNHYLLGIFIEQEKMIFYNRLSTYIHHKKIHCDQQERTNELLGSPLNKNENLHDPMRCTSELCLHCLLSKPCTSPSDEDLHLSTGSDSGCNESKQDEIFDLKSSSPMLSGQRDNFQASPLTFSTSLPSSSSLGSDFGQPISGAKPGRKRKRTVIDFEEDKAESKGSVVEDLTLLDDKALLYLLERYHFWLGPEHSRLACKEIIKRRQNLTIKEHPLSFAVCNIYGMEDAKERSEFIELLKGFLMISFKHVQCGRRRVALRVFGTVLHSTLRVLAQYQQQENSLLSKVKELVEKYNKVSKPFLRNSRKPLLLKPEGQGDCSIPQAENGREEEIISGQVETVLGFFIDYPLQKKSLLNGISAAEKVHVYRAIEAKDARLLFSLPNGDIKVASLSEHATWLSKCRDQLKSAALSKLS